MASVALTALFLFEAFTVYPDGLGAVLVMTGIVALVDPDRLSSPLRAAGHGAALALLPWLHTRFALLAVVLGAALVLRRATNRDRRTSSLLAFGLVPVVSAACWFLSFYLIYGTFSPAAPYGGYTQSRLANVSRGLTGLLIDQQFGVMPNAPIFLAGLAGLWLLARTHRRLSIELAAVVAPYTVVVACYQMWWGGHSSPGRFIVPILLAFGLPCAVLWRRLTGPLVRVLLVALLAGSIGLALALAWSARGALVYNFRDGVSLWLEAASPVVTLPAALPSLFRGSAGDAWMIAAAWLLVAAIVMTIAVGAIRGFGFSPGTIRAVVAPAVVAAILTLGPSAGWTVARAQALDVGNGLWRVVRGLSKGGLAVRMLPPEWIDGSAAARELLIPGVRHGERGSGTHVLLAGGIPPGDYQLVGESGLRVNGSVAIAVGRGSLPMFDETLREAPSSSLLVVHLPVGARELTITPDKLAQRDAGRLLIRPIQVWDNAVPFARLGRTYGDLRAWVVDETTSLEEQGFWTLGRGTTQVVLSADAPHDLVLVLRNGPVLNTAVVSVSLLTNGGRREVKPAQVVAVEPGAQKQIDLGSVFGLQSAVFGPQPADAGLRTTNHELRTTVLLSIQTEQGFRPADVDPTSTDRRVLGVWASLH